LTTRREYAIHKVVKLPSCGLYRVTRPLPGREDDVPVGALVNFHNHSEQNMPVVLLPAHNVFNRWQWEATPIHIRQLSWIETLQSLPPEGFYALRGEVEFNEGKSRWPKGALVQLGYDRGAQPIVFIAQQRHHLAENSLWFAEQGVKLGTEGLSLLQPLVVYEEPDPAAAGGEKKT
jgi:hypothetical protein